MNFTDIAHTRLHNLQLAQTALHTPAEMVSWMGGVQAQDFAAAKWSLGLRLRPTTDEVMEIAFNNGDILRTHMMRPTWHFVTPADIRWIQRLTAPRVHIACGTMYRQEGLDAATRSRAGSVITKALENGRALTRDELGEALEAHGLGPAKGHRLAYMVMWAELEALIGSGPRRGKQFTYMLLDERAPHAMALEGDEALVELLRRYFTSHGPATAHDFSRWSGLTLADTYRGLDMLGSALYREEVDEQTYWFGNESLPPREPSPTAYLLNIYDEYTIGYKDRRAISDDETMDALQAMGNALQNVIVVDGRIVGTWRRTLRKTEVSIELNLLRPLTGRENDAVMWAATQYGEYIGRAVEVSGLRG
ncbi:MAG: winged helix DNA-binding domain-containing protein [Chloroflexota bacterium]